MSNYSIQSGTRLDAEVVLSEVMDTPGVSGVLTDEERAERDRLLAEYDLMGDPWATPGMLDAEPPF